jgi:nucleoside-diphosphate-sugar epimerase
MKIFVTGATGFIGTHFINLASSDGHDITALCRSFYISQNVHSNSIRWLHKNLSDLEEIDFIDHDVLVHLAAHSANHPYDTLENCLYWNLLISLRVIQKAHQAGVKRIVVAGSCFEYGLSSNRYDRIPTEAPLEPILSYPVSKAAASLAMVGLAREKNIDLTILRIFQVYGPGELESRFWPSLKKAALTGTDFLMSRGDQIRDFIRVEDVAKAFLSESTLRVFNKSKIIKNIGTGIPLKLADFAEYWWRRWDAKGQLIMGAVPLRSNELKRIVAKID